MTLRNALITLGLTLGITAQGAPADRPGGFWKCRAKSPVKGEFGGEDPVGLAAGKHIRTDCVIFRHYGAKTYCFGSLPSLDFFSSEPELLAKAEAFWAKSRSDGAARP